MSETHQISNVSGNLTTYFESRSQAGAIIAGRLVKYKKDTTSVLALSRGGVLVGAEIAKQLHSSIAMLLTKDIYLPDGRTVIGIINEIGGFVYNNYFAACEIEDLESEYRNNIEQAKMQALHEIHVALGRSGIISPQYFRNHVVIVVTDASFNGMAFDMAYEYLKKIQYKKLVMVTPIANEKAVDKMHVIADDLVCLSVTDGIFDANHYFNNNLIPNQEKIEDILNNTILNWHNPDSIINTRFRVLRRHIY